MGTALAGSVLIAVLSASFISGIVQSPQVPDSAKKQAKVHLSAGVPFISDAQLRSVLKQEKAPAKVIEFVVNDNALARIKALQTALALVALLCVIALFFTGRLPRAPAGTASAADPGVAGARAPPEAAV